jgi:hypothetical protein
MKKQKKIHFLPQTIIGKISFWLVIISLIGLYLQYWIAIASGLSIPPILGLLPMGLLIICGITSIVAIIKYMDKAILLFLSALLGILGILFVIAELIFPH